MTTIYYLLFLGELALFVGELYMVYQLGKLSSGSFDFRETKEALILQQSKLIELEARIASVEQKIHPNPGPPKPLLHPNQVEKPNLEWMKKYGGAA